MLSNSLNWGLRKQEEPKFTLSHEQRQDHTQENRFDTEFEEMIGPPGAKRTVSLNIQLKLNGRGSSWRN